MHGFIFGFSVLFHWSLCLFWCQHHTVLITVAMLYNLKSGSEMPQALFSFLRHLGSFVAPYEFQDCFSYMKNAFGILIGIVEAIDSSELYEHVLPKLVVGRRLLLTSARV